MAFCIRGCQSHDVSTARDLGPLHLVLEGKGMTLPSWVLGTVPPFCQIALLVCVGESHQTKQFSDWNVSSVLGFFFFFGRLGLTEGGSGFPKDE